MRAGVVLEVDPEPKGRVVVLEPSEPDVIEPEPNGLVVLEEPPEEEPPERDVVEEPEPNDLELLLTVFPFLDGSAACEMPEPAIKTVTRIATTFSIILIFPKVCLF